MREKVYIGIDVGSVSTNLVLVNQNQEVIDKLYLRTRGNPIKVLQDGISMLKDKYDDKIMVLGVGTTGSGRQLASFIVGADIVKMKLLLMLLQVQLMF